MSGREPYTRHEARKLVSRLLSFGSVVFWEHCDTEAGKDGISRIRLTQGLQFGLIIEEAEEKDGRWRYRIHHEDLCAVVQFEGLKELHVVTCWRKKKGRR